eukprot:1626770-Pleurochrysis_carterae.AAC.1
MQDSNAYTMFRTEREQDEEHAHGEEEEAIWEVRTHEAGEDERDGQQPQAVRCLHSGHDDDSKEGNEIGSRS